MRDRLCAGDKRGERSRFLVLSMFFPLSPLPCLHLPSLKEEDDGDARATRFNNDGKTKNHYCTGQYSTVRTKKFFFFFFVLRNAFSFPVPSPQSCLCACLSSSRWPPPRSSQSGRYEPPRGSHTLLVLGTGTTAAEVIGLWRGVGGLRPRQGIHGGASGIAHPSLDPRPASPPWRWLE